MCYEKDEAGRTLSFDERQLLNAKTNKNAAHWNVDKKKRTLEVGQPRLRLMPHQPARTTNPNNQPNHPTNHLIRHNPIPKQTHHALSDSHIISPVVPSDIVMDLISKPSMMRSPRAVCGVMLTAAADAVAAAAAPLAASANSSSSCASSASLPFDSQSSILEFSSKESLLSSFSEHHEEQDICFLS